MMKATRLPAPRRELLTAFGRILLLSVLVGGLSPAMAAIVDYPFRLVVREAGTGHQVVAENNGPAPIAVAARSSGG